MTDSRPLHSASSHLTSSSDDLYNASHLRHDEPIGAWRPIVDGYRSRVFVLDSNGAVIDPECLASFTDNAYPGQNIVHAMAIEGVLSQIGRDTTSSGRSASIITTNQAQLQLLEPVATEHNLRQWAGATYGPTVSDVKLIESNHLLHRDVIVVDIPDAPNCSKSTFEKFDALPMRQFMRLMNSRDRSLIVVVNMAAIPSMCSDMRVAIGILLHIGCVLRPTSIW